MKRKDDNNLSRSSNEMKMRQFENVFGFYSLHLDKLAEYVNPLKSVLTKLISAHQLSLCRTKSGSVFYLDERLKG